MSNLVNDIAATAFTPELRKQFHLPTKENGESFTKEISELPLER